MLSVLWIGAAHASVGYVNRLSKQEQLVLCVILGLLLTGWAVKAYRNAHPPVQAVEIPKP